MSLLPHWVRAVVVIWSISAWVVLEIGYRAALGDVSWLDVPSPVHLEPQARQAVLTLRFGRREVTDAGVVPWVVPVWRFFGFRPKDRPVDRLDLTQMLSPGCLWAPTDQSMSRLGRIATELALRVWIARHWDEERIVDRWGSCVASELETCGEHVPSVLSLTDAVHLWAHDTGRGACKERWVDHRQRAARGMLWLLMPELRAAVFESPIYADVPRCIR